ncbi:unannotated protein [freshwater metagenome]|uniref:Unannotated protein n=1 Tax=freshwater metagenome TaxID=449393 RepID=A0A6J6VPY3_9ZZZZ
MLPPRTTPFDLHVLGTPPAFVLSQDQTLRRKLSPKANLGTSNHFALTTKVVSAILESRCRSGCSFIDWHRDSSHSVLLIANCDCPLCLLLCVETRVERRTRRRTKSCFPHRLFRPLFCFQGARCRDHVWGWLPGRLLPALRGPHRSAAGSSGPFIVPSDPRGVKPEGVPLGSWAGASEPYGPSDCVRRVGSPFRSGFGTVCPSQRARRIYPWRPLAATSRAKEFRISTARGMFVIDHDHVHLPLAALDQQVSVMSEIGEGEYGIGAGRAMTVHGDAVLLEGPPGV